MMPNIRDNSVVLHLSCEYPPQISGGLGVAVQQLCEGQRAIDGGREVEVILPDSELSSAYDCYKVCGNRDGEFLKNAWGQRLLNKGMLDESELSVVHAHDWMAMPAAMELSKAHGTKLVYHVHSTALEREGEHARGEVYELEKEMLEEADLAVAVSAISKENLVRRYGIPSDKVVVVHNALRKNWNGELAHGWNAGNQKTLLFVGRMVEQKGVLFALEVMVGLLRRHAEWTAVLAGSGALLDAVRALIHFHGMDGRIEAIGRVPNERMPSVYERADVVLMPSMAEPFGLVALEAAAAGLPVIVSPQVGAREVLVTAPCIELHREGDWVACIEKLLGDEELWSSVVVGQMQSLKKHQLGVEQRQWDSIRENLERLDG